MKKKEMAFCRLTAVTGNPHTAAVRAGYRRPDEAWPELIARRDIADEIGRVTREVSKVFRDTLMCAALRLTAADNNDAVKLVYREQVSDDELREMDLSGIAEIKRTKDKSVEIKFFDRLKALDRLSELSGADADSAPEGGLLEAMRLSAQALRGMRDREAEAHED